MPATKQDFQNFLNLPLPGDHPSGLKEKFKEMESTLEEQAIQLSTTTAEQELLVDFCNQLYAIEARAIEQLQEQFVHSEQTMIGRHVESSIKQEKESAKNRLKTRIISEKMLSDARLEANIREEEFRALERLQESLERERKTAKEHQRVLLASESERLDLLLSGRLKQVEKEYASKLLETKNRLAEDLKSKVEKLRILHIKSFRQKKKEMLTSHQEKLADLIKNRERRGQLAIEAEKFRLAKDYEEKVAEVRQYLKNLRVAAQRDTEDEIKILRQRHQENIAQLRAKAGSQVVAYKARLKKRQEQLVQTTADKLNAIEGVTISALGKNQAEHTIDIAEKPARKESEKGSQTLSRPSKSPNPQSFTSEQKELTSKLIVSAPERVDKAIKCFTEEEQMHILGVCGRFTKENILKCAPDLEYLAAVEFHPVLDWKTQRNCLRKFISLL